jgi:hypothetical protein
LAGGERVEGEAVGDTDGDCAGREREFGWVCVVWVKK